MYRGQVVIQQMRSPIRRHKSQRATLIGLKLNRIGRLSELPNSPETHGMIAKVSHLVRVVSIVTELDLFVKAVRVEYRELINTKIIRGDALWAQFEEAVAAYLVDPRKEDRYITERVNELAVAKVLLDDHTLVEQPITYEPDLLPSGRKIDFVVDRGTDNLYVEVKTVRPRTSDNEAAWQKFIERKRFHPKNVNFILEQEWMGGAIYGNVFSSRSRFLEYSLDFETRLEEARTIRGGPGVLVFCGNGFAWHKSSLEDFADFYRTGKHRDDDPFALMEQHHIEHEKIQLRHNIDYFAFLKRRIELPQIDKFYFPVRGPRFFLPPPTPLQPNLQS